MGLSVRNYVYVADDASSAVAPPRRVTRYERIVKPAIDRFFALVLSCVFAPVMLVVALLVRIDLGRSVILRQQRVGRDGRMFIVHKFRTMSADRRCAHLDYEGADRRRTHKHPNDPRLTSLGRALRKWSLDEIPQLWDVLAGNMSLVGPRPELPAIVARYEPWQHARHAVKPGLTGLWQVKARGNGEMHECTDLDIEYATRVTLRADMKILFTTPFAVLAGRGF